MVDSFNLFFPQGSSRGILSDNHELTFDSFVVVSICGEKLIFINNSSIVVTGNQAIVFSPAEIIKFLRENKLYIL